MHTKKHLSFNALRKMPSRRFLEIRLRVFEKWNGKPGPAFWLMIRRSLGPGERKIKFYLSSAPETVSISEMAWAGCQRWSTEVDFILPREKSGSIIMI